MELEELKEKIKNLEIQGARNVAKSVVKFMIDYIKKTNENPKKIIEDMIKIGWELMNVRPTEPMTRQMVKEILHLMIVDLNKYKNEDLDSFKKHVINDEMHYLNLFDKNMEIISEIGSNYLPEHARIITYCHSSTVVAILKKAFDKGKIDSVYTCETRPLFQGRITAKELVEYGIDTTLIVDGALGVYTKHVDLAIVGGDVVTSAGDLVNKIGTSTLAEIMFNRNKPFFSAVESYKYDIMSEYGYRITIEQRAISEVWNSPPKGLKIKNPAFDVTPAKFINAYITEKGIVPPQQFRTLITKTD